MLVDAHQHFWHYTSREFGWIDDTMASIRRDFLPSHLAPLLRDSGIGATVAVQARQSLEETDWLLDLAEESGWIAGVVGWVPLTDPDVEATLQQLCVRPKLKGVRHVLQAESDAYMERAEFNAGVALLRQYGLTYDLLVLERQLPAAMAFVDRQPEQPIVLDHLAKPLIARQELEPWRTNIRELARRPQIHCKLSGMVTEAVIEQWSVEHLRPYFDTALEAFGAERLLFGSDWPVCTVASNYRRWTDAFSTLIGELSQEEQGKILGGNAVKFYKLAGPDNSLEVQLT